MILSILGLHPVNQQEQDYHFRPVMNYLARSHLKRQTPNLHLPLGESPSPLLILTKIPYLNVGPYPIELQCTETGIIR